VRDIEKQRARGVGDIDRVLARQLEADIVLGHQHSRDARVDIGLVAPQPEYLRRGEAGEGTVAGQPNQTLEADSSFDLRALGAGALVVPEHRRTQHLVVIVQADQTVHLTREADATHISDAGRGVESGYPFSALAITSPSGDMAMVLTPYVPTSTPMTAVTAGTVFQNEASGHRVAQELELSGIRLAGQT